MAEALRFEIIVDDKGTPQLRQFGDTAQGLARQTQTLSDGFAVGARQALGFGAAVLGLGAGVQVLRSLGQAYLDFDAAVANVNTLIPRQVALQAQLRQELLQLPPALGSSADLARGLYDTLSSGIKPAEAVAFVADAARLAKAGLADMETATTALTKTIAVYGFEAKDAARISDVFFQVVNVGQGSLQQFAAAFPNVLVAAKGLGVSFLDASAALATLSSTFKSPAEASTGLVSLFSQLVQNIDEFAKRGVNLRQIIDDEGLAGALRVLRDLTKGNSEALRPFVNDIQGVQAALSLTGAQLDKFIASQAKVAEQTAPTSAALSEQGKSVTATYQGLGNAVAQYTTQFLDNVKASALGQSVLGGLTRAVTTLTAGLETQAQAADKAAKALNAEADAATNVGTATEEAGKSLAKVTAEQERAERQASALASAYKGLGVESNESLQQLAEGARKNFLAVLAAGQEPPERLVVLYEGAAKKIQEATGTIPEFFRQVGQDLILRAEEQVDRLSTIYEQVGVQSRSVLQLQAQATLQQLKSLINDPDINPRHLVDAYLDATRTINEAGFRQLPKEWAEVNRALQDIARKAGVELPQPFVDGLGQIELGFKKVDETATETFGKIADNAQTAAKQTAQLSAEAIRLGHSFDALGNEVNAYGNAVAKASDETEKLQNLRIAVETPFAADLEGLLRQLADIQRHMSQIQVDSFLTLENKNAIVAADLKIIAEIERRILLLRAGEAQATPPPSGGTTPPPTSPTGGSRPTSGGAIPGSGLFNGFAPAPGTRPTPPPSLLGGTRGDPAPESLLRPPGSLNLGGEVGTLPAAVQQAVALLQERYQAALASGDVGRQAALAAELQSRLPYGYFLNRGTGEVIRLGSRLGQAARPAPVLTPSEAPELPPERPSGGGGRDGYQGPGGSALPGVTLGPPSAPPSGPVDNVGAPIGGTASRGGINIIINAAALTRGSAQELAEELAPALRELQRRGAL